MKIISKDFTIVDGITLLMALIFGSAFTYGIIIGKQDFFESMFGMIMGFIVAYGLRNQDYEAEIRRLKARIYDLENEVK